MKKLATANFELGAGNFLLTKNLLPKSENHGLCAKRFFAAFGRKTALER